MAVLTPVDDAEVEDFLLASAEEFVRGREQADRNLGAGRTKPLSTVLAELDA